MTREEAPDGITVRYGLKDNMTKTVTLYDNADLENGDEIKGDGIYSAYVDLYDPDTYIYFVAEYESIKSNIFRLETIGLLKDGEIDPVDIVRDEVYGLSDSPGFWDMPAEDRKNTVLELVNSYKEQGLIEKVFVFEDINEILFVSPTGRDAIFYYDGILTPARKNKTD